MGLHVGRLLFGVYANSGFLAGLAGVILASQFGAGQPTEGVGWELFAIASVVVGGTLLTGGVGSIGATLAGALLLAMLFNILNFENGRGWISLSAYWQSVIRGLFLLAVVILQAKPALLQHLDVFSRGFAPLRVTLLVIGYALALIKVAQASALDSRDVYEHVIATSFWLYEAKPLAAIEPFYLTDRHFTLLFSTSRFRHNTSERFAVLFGSTGGTPIKQPHGSEPPKSCHAEAH